MLSMMRRSCRKCWPRCFLAGSEKWGLRVLMRTSCRPMPVESEAVEGDAGAGVGRGEQAGRIGRAQSGQFQRRAVVHRDARVGQAEREVHGTLEAAVLEYRQPLVV